MENQIIELLDALFGQEQAYIWSTYILPNGHYLNPENYTEDPEFEPVYEHEDFLYPFRDNYDDVDLFLLMKVIDKYCIKINVTYPYLYLPENRITDKQLKVVENILLNHLGHMEPMEYNGLMILTPKNSEKLYSWEELLDVKQVLRDIKMFYVTGVLESNKINTKLLLRFIGPTEHNKLLNGEEIRALTLPRGNTSIKHKVVFFLETTRKTLYDDIRYYLEFLLGVVDTSAVVVIETNIYMTGIGVYADPKGTWDDYIEVKEYGVPSYSLKDVVEIVDLTNYLRY